MSSYEIVIDRRSPFSLVFILISVLVLIKSTPSGIVSNTLNSHHLDPKSVALTLSPAITGSPSIKEPIYFVSLSDLRTLEPVNGERVIFPASF